MTPTKMETGDAAAAATVRINDTTQATTSGTALTIYEDAFSLLSGWFDVPVPEEVRVIAPGEKFVLDFPAIATSGLAWNGSVVFEEIG